MSWRPKNWDNPYNDKYRRKPWTEWFQSDAELAYEAGANDMLEALRKRGFLDMGSYDKLEIKGVYAKPIKFVADCNGKLVLIPDEEDG